MKVAATLLVAGFLLATPAVVGAVEPAPEAEISPLSQALPVEAAEEPAVEPALFAPAAQCQADSEPSAAVGAPEPTPMALSCGACSTPSKCRGVPRGTPCGPGCWCNIYSGGFMCPTGGWDCQCGCGPLP